MRWLTGSLIVLAVASRGAGQEGLLHQWQFGPEHVRDRTVQAVAGKLDGTIVGEVRFTSDRPQVLQFAGDAKTRGRINVTSDLAKANLPAKAISVEAWVWIDRTQEWGGIIGAFQDNGPYEKGWLLGFTHDRFFFAVASKGDKKLTYLKAASRFEPGSWYHVLGTYDGTDQRIYVDGKLQARSREQSGAIDYPPKGFFTIGAYHDDNELYPLAGRLDLVSVFDRALSAEQVTARFQERKVRFPDIDAVPPQVTDWPTYLRDPRRSGLAPEQLSFPLRLQWVYQSRQPPRPSWPEEARHDYWHKKYNLDERVTYDRAFHLVSVGDRVWFGSSAEDRICCLDTVSGQERWSFFTEGPVRLAPTIVGDRLLAGSDDGFVWCLNAESGQLVWKTRVAPEARRVAGNERIISAWPVRTDILVDDRKGYFCAGVFPSQGVYQGVLDLDTGRLLETQPLAVTAQGYLEQVGGKLHVSTGRNPAGAFVSKLRRSGKAASREVTKLPADFPYAFIGAGDVRIGGGDGQIAAFRVADGSKVWSASVEGRVWSLVAVRGRLLASTDRGHIYCFGAGQAKPRVIQPSRPVEPVYPDPGTKQRYAAAADWIVRQAGAQRGYCLVLDSAEGWLTYELVRRTSWQVIGREANLDHVTSARRMLDAAGLAGRVAIHQGSSETLPYADCLFNVVVSDTVARTGSFAGPRAEAERVLRPHGGLAVFGLTERDLVRRGPLEGEGEWTHMYADAGNTTCSGDRRIGSQFQLQWFGPPGARPMIDRHHRTVAPLYKNGRLFVPGDDRVIGVDAYNGTILWDREVPNSRRVVAFRDCSYLVLADDHLYVSAADRCLALDPQTGTTVATFSVPAGKKGSKQEWGYLGCMGQVLLASAVKPGSSRRTQSHEVDRTETYYDFVPLVGSDFLFALDRHTGKERWTYYPRAGLIINPTIAIAGNSVFFVESGNPETLAKPIGRAKLAELLGKGAEVVALDLQTGKELWRRPGKFEAMQHNIYLACAQDRVVVVGSRNSGTVPLLSSVFYDIHAFDTRTGERKWFQTQDQHMKIGGDHGEQDQHPVIVGERLYCEPYAYNLPTGERIDWKWPWVNRKRGGCGNISASASTFFFRNGTVSLFDLTTNQAKPVTTETRPGCWINLLPAGGLLLAPEASSGCTCNFSVQTSLALMPVPQPRQPAPPK